MKANKEQPVQTIVTHFKKKGQRLFKLATDYQQGVKKMRITVVIMYQDIPPNETFRLYTSTGKYMWDVKAEILITPARTCVYQAYLTKKPDEILEELMIGVTVGVYLFVMFQVM